MQPVRAAGAGGETTAALQALCRAVHARKLYTEKSAALERMMNDVATRFATLLRSTPELIIRVRSNAFIVGDEQIDDPHPESAVTRALFRDGVRRLTFSEGLELDELRTVIDAIAHGLSLSSAGDDIVSRLWHENLEHVKYLAIDTLIVQAASATSGDLELNDEPSEVAGEIETLIRSIYGGEGSGDLTTQSLHIDGTELSAKAIADVLGDRHAPAGFVPTRAYVHLPAYSIELLDQLNAEDDASLAMRAVGAALDAFSGSLSDSDARAASELLFRMYDVALGIGDMSIAVHIVNGMRDRPRAEDWLVEATSEARLRQVVTIFRGTGVESDTAAELLKAFGPRVVPTLLKLAQSVALPPQRRKLCDLIVQLGIDDPDDLEKLLKEEDLNIALEAVYMLGKLATPKAQAILLDAKKDQRPEVRSAILAIGARLGALAIEIPLGMINDPNPTVRMTAARALAVSPSREAARALFDAVARASFEDESTEVKVVFLESFATLHQQRALPHLTKLIKRADGMFAKKDLEDTAILSVNAMALVRAQKSVEILKETCSSHNKRVREAAREALIRMKG